MNNKNLVYVSNLISDACSENKIAKFSSEQIKFTDEAIRKAFFEILEDDKLTYQNWRNHKNEIFTVIENVLNTNLPLAWENSPFYDQFVEYKNGALGDKNAFVVEDHSTLIASSFSGNHWNTERQKLNGVKEVTAPTSWIYIHVYDELEKFLVGNQTVARMMTQMQKGFNTKIDDMIVTNFNSISTYIPSAFKESGSYDRDTMMTLIQKVELATQSPVILAGSKTVLQKIVSGYTSGWVADSQKEELASTGMVLNETGLGVQGIVIPQSFTRGTYTFKNANNVLYVLPANFKPVKAFFEGETRARELTMQDTDDQTIDTQVQTKVGVATVISDLCGTYTIS